MLLTNVWWLLAALLLEVAWWSSATSTMPKEVEDNLMSLFGFKRRPRGDRSKVVIPQAMLELYERQTGRRLDTASILKPGLHTRSANTVRSFTHIESSIDARFPGHHKFRLKFDVGNIPSGERLKAAELALSRQWLLSNDASDPNEHLQHVLIRDIIKPGIKGKRAPITRLIDSKLIDTRRNHTLSMDLVLAVDRWMASPKSNHGVLVHVLGYGKNKTPPTRHVRLRRDVGEGERSWSRRQPLLFTYTDDGKNKQVIGAELAAKRARRASNRKKKGRKEMRETCRRHPMYVDFAEVGWNNWIVAPPGYDAYYCHGECTFPLAEHLNTTNHAIVQTLVNSVSPSKVPRPCCVPTQLNSISMLYVDDGNKVVLKNYKEMAVIGCGCR